MKVMLKKYQYGGWTPNLLDYKLQDYSVVPDAFKTKWPPKLFNIELPKPTPFTLPKSDNKIPAFKKLTNSVWNNFKENPEIYGAAANIGSTILGNRPEYEGDKGYITQIGDSAYDTLANAVYNIPGYGKFAWAGMQGAKLLGKGVGKIGGGTDGMTTFDAIMGTSGLNLTPLALINGFGGKRANTLNNQNYFDQQKLNDTADAYAQDEAERREAERKSGKKFGLFSSGSRHSANRLIGEENRDANIRLAIADDMNLQKIRGQYMTSINNQNYQNLINGGLKPISFGQKGMKIDKKRLKRISKMANEKIIQPKEDEYQTFLSILPENLRNEDPEYNMHRYWELNGKPTSWFDALNNGMFTKEKDGFWHSNTVAYNKDVDEYEFMKSPKHPTINKELEWYNSPDGYEFAKEYELIKPEDGSNYKYIKRKENVEAFKQGGQMNLIPEGALHARKNNMELAKEGGVTSKGIPVVSTDKSEEQQAEIEREELILNKDNTNYIEERYKKFYSDDITEEEKNKLAIEVGKKFVKELFTNTDDRTGLIEKVENKV